MCTGFNLPGRFGFGRTAVRCAIKRQKKNVSICQADLGLAELLVSTSSSRRISKCFNLPGRFGFGRTRSLRSGGRWAAKFQSARQIWVWPNTALPKSTKRHSSTFQSARQIWVWPNPDHVRVAAWIAAGFNLPGRFGFGRTLSLPFFALKRAWVSICQADLGLAEPNTWTSFSMAVQAGFNLPGRFGFGRTEIFPCSRCGNDSFNLPGRFGFGRTPL